MTEKYTVMVDDNFHYMDEGERHIGGRFDTADEALAVAKAIVDKSLGWEMESRPGMTWTAVLLYDYYTDFGDDPFIVALPGVPKVDFSAWTYAKQKAEEMCAVGKAE